MVLTASGFGLGFILGVPVHERSLFAPDLPALFRNPGNRLPGLRKRAGRSGAKRERSWTGTPRMKPRPKPDAVSTKMRREEGRGFRLGDW